MRVKGGLESQRRSRVVTRDYESQQLVASRNDGLGSSWSGYESQRDSQPWFRLVLFVGFESRRGGFDPQSESQLAV